MLLAPALWVWALAESTIEPRTNAAADKVIPSFRISPPPRPRLSSLDALCTTAGLSRFTIHVLGLADDTEFRRRLKKSPGLSTGAKKSKPAPSDIGLPTKPIGRIGLPQAEWNPRMLRYASTPTAKVHFEADEWKIARGRHVRATLTTALSNASKVSRQKARQGAG